MVVYQKKFEPIGGKNPLDSLRFLGKKSRYVLSYRCKDTQVPGAGYSPGAFQRRILCWLRDSLRLATVRIDDGIHPGGY
jgi:hypothetical protein